MNKFLLSLIVFFLLTSQVWADADTLRPVGDRAKTDWTVYPSGDRWDAFDDTTTNEDVNYVYNTATVSTIKEGWYHTDWDGSGTIDSVRLTVRAKQAEAGSGASKIIISRNYSSEMFWYDCSSDEGTDTVTLTTGYVNYPITWVNNPCTDEAWTSAGLNSSLRVWMFRNLAVAEKEVADTLQPTADGGAGWCSSAWSPSGCQGHYDCVDDAPGSPDGDATSMSVADDYNIDCFTLETATLDGDIDSIVLWANAKRTGEAATLNLSFLPTAYTPHLVGAVDLTTDYANYSATSTEDLGSNAWTNTKINDHKWAYNVEGGNNNRTVTQFFAIVYYTQPVANRVTQSFVEVFYTPSAEEEKGIVKIYKNGAITKIYENGETVKIYEP